MSAASARGGCRSSACCDCCGGRRFTPSSDWTAGWVPRKQNAMRLRSKKRQQ